MLAALKGTLGDMTSDGGVLGSYRRAGQASAAAANLESAHLSAPGAKSAAFFDVDNTIMRGSSLFHIALGLARRNYFSASEIAGFAVKQMKFVMTGSEDLEDMASATEAGMAMTWPGISQAREHSGTYLQPFLLMICLAASSCMRCVR